ncbi:MAG: hypothetical protein ACT443_05915 [Gemmatimonadota bacterium]
MMGRLGAWTNLGWHFALHVLTRMPLRPLRRGADLQRFNDAAAAEGYHPLGPPARAAFPRYMNCVHCGLCAIACESLQAAPASAWSEAWTFVGGASRSLDRTRLVAADLSPCAHEPAAEAVCPTEIPIRQMAATIRGLAK